MRTHRHSKHAMFRIWLGTGLISFLVTSIAVGKEIRATLTPSNPRPLTGEQVTVAIDVHASENSPALGSYTASVKWDPHVLKFVGYTGGSTAGFSKPMVNKAETGNGRLIVAHAYPHGGKSSVNIFNVIFEVIGGNGKSGALEVKFLAMAAARTFDDLLPQLETLTTGETNDLTVAEMPKEFALHQNHPNPFNPETEIRYEVSKEGRVTLGIYNLLGQRVKTLVHGIVKAGKHTARWEGTDESGKNVPSGVYVYRLEADGTLVERKMTLLR